MLASCIVTVYNNEETIDICLESLLDLDYSQKEIFEYMASGKTIISTDLGSIPKIIENQKTWIIIKPGDIDTLSSSIIKILEDQELIKRFGERPRKIVEKYHDWRNYTKKLYRIFKELIKKSPNVVKKWLSFSLFSGRY